MDINDYQQLIHQAQKGIWTTSKDLQHRSKQILQKLMHKDSHLCPVPEMEFKLVDDVCKQWRSIFKETIPRIQIHAQEQIHLDKQIQYVWMSMKMRKVHECV